MQRDHWQEGGGWQPRNLQMRCWCLCQSFHGESTYPFQGLLIFKIYFPIGQRNACLLIRHALLQSFSFCWRWSSLSCCSRTTIIVHFEKSQNCTHMTGLLIWLCCHWGWVWGLEWEEQRDKETLWWFTQTRVHFFESRLPILWALMQDTNHSYGLWIMALRSMAKQTWMFFRRFWSRISNHSWKLPTCSRADRKEQYRYC